MERKVHPDLKLLSQVDWQDRAIDLIRKNKGKADATVTDARAEAKAARAEQERLEHELAATQKHERVTQRSIEQYENRRTSATNVLEGGGGDPEAAERQLNSVNEILDNLETTLLEAIEKGEALEVSISAAKAAVVAADEVVAAAIAQHPKTIQVLKAEYAAAKSARDKAFESLDTGLQSKYEAVRARKVRAVSLIVNEVCKMCQRVVQPQHLSDLARGLMKPCGGCGRWIVFEQTG